MPLETEQSITVSVSGSSVALATATNWIPMNQFEEPFNVGFGVVKSGGGDLSFTVQHTFKNVLVSASVPTAEIFDHSDVSGQTSSIDGNYAFPVRAIRVTTVSASGSARIDFRVLQTGY